MYSFKIVSHYKLGKIDFSEMSSNLTQEGSWSKKTLLAREYFIFISNLKRTVLVAKDGLKLILNSNFISFFMNSMIPSIYLEKDDGIHPHSNGILGLKISTLSS